MSFPKHIGSHQSCFLATRLLNLIKLQEVWWRESSGLLHPSDLIPHFNGPLTLGLQCRLWTCRYQHLSVSWPPSHSSYPPVLVGMNSDMDKAAVLDPENRPLLTQMMKAPKNASLAHVTTLTPVLRPSPEQNFLEWLFSTETSAVNHFVYFRNARFLFGKVEKCWLVIKSSVDANDLLLWLPSWLSQVQHVIMQLQKFSRCLWKWMFSTSSYHPHLRMFRKTSFYRLVIWPSFVVKDPQAVKGLWDL